MKKKVLAATAAGLLGGVGLIGFDPHVAGAATPATPAASAWGAKAHVSAVPTAAAKALLATAGRTAATSPLGAVTVADDYGFIATGTPVPVTISSGSSTLYSLNEDTRTSSTGVVGTNSFPLDLPAGTYTITAQIPAGVLPAATVTGTLTVVAGGDTDEVLGAFTTGDPTASWTGVTNNIAQANGTAVLSLRDASNSPYPLTVKIDGTSTGTTYTDGTNTDIKLPGGTHTIEVDSGGQVLNTTTASFTNDNFYDVYLFTVQPTATSTPSAGTNQNLFIQGYQFAAADGGVFSYGGRLFAGSLGGLKLAAPIVGGANFNPFPGYYLVGSDGGVFAFGAKFQGSLGGTKLAKPIVGMGSDYGTDGTGGYNLLGADGGVFAYNTPYYGSLGGSTLTSPAVAIAVDQGNGTYWIAQANGAVTQFGPAGVKSFAPPATTLAKPIVGIAEVPQTGALFLVASDGGVFAENGAGFVGSAGNITLNKPIVGIIPSYDGLGYDLIASDGGVFSYGDATFYGSTGNIRLAEPVVAALNS